MSTAPNDPSASDRLAPAGKRKSWKRAFLFGLGMAVGAVVFAGFLWLPAISQELQGNATATTLLLVARDQPSLVQSSRLDSRESDADWEFYKRNQIVLIKTRPVLNAALRDPKVPSLSLIRNLSDPIAWLEKHLQVDFVDGSGLLRIRLSGGKPEEMVKLVDAVTEAYLNEIVYKENHARLSRVNKLRGLLIGSEEELRGKRKTLKLMTEQAAGGPSLEELAADSRELRRVRYSQIDVQAKLTVYKADKNPDKGILAIISKLEREGAILKEKARLLQNSFERARTSTSQAIDTKFFRDEMTTTEDLIRQIASERARLEVEMQAPPRVRKYMDAISSSN